MGSRLVYGNGVGRMWVSDEPVANPFDYWWFVNHEGSIPSYRGVVFDAPHQIEWWRSFLRARPPEELAECDPLALLRAAGYGLDRLASPAPANGTSYGDDHGASAAGWLALLAVGSLADVPFHLGLDDLYFGVPEFRSCVLRSWHERYGALLFRCSGSTMSLVVSHPPTSVETARLLAQEHLAFSPETYTWAEGRSEDQFIEAIAERLLLLGRWDFWWD